MKQKEIDFEEIAIAVRAVEDEMARLAKLIREKGNKISKNEFKPLVKECQSYSNTIDEISKIYHTCPKDQQEYLEHVFVSTNYVRSIITTGNCIVEDGMSVLFLAIMLNILAGLENEATNHQHGGGFWICSPRLLKEAIKLAFVGLNNSD